MKILKGNIIFTRDKDRFEVHEHSYIAIDNGKVLGIFPTLEEVLKAYSDKQDIQVIDHDDAIIIPSFIDLHIHAPQYMQMGIGLDLELIEWLRQYTFMLEQRFENPEYAKKVYPVFVQDLYERGTFRAVIYGTIHQESNRILAEAVRERGLSAYIGKVNMDQYAPDALLQDWETSLRETEAFVQEYYQDSQIKPIITPRFVPSCSKKLLEGLGKLAENYKVPIQSHLSENLHEVEWVQELYPKSPNYSTVYKGYSLYEGGKTLMAHAIHLTSEEVQMAKSEGVMLVHCPNANMNLSSGIMPLTRYIDEGLTIGLGSDVGAGHRIGMNYSVTSAIQCSKLLHLFNPENRILKESEAFYLATKANGTFFKDTGSFEPGYSFDALVVKDYHPLMNALTPMEQLQRFLYCGGPESIIARYFMGEAI